MHRILIGIGLVALVALAAVVNAAPASAALNVCVKSASGAIRVATGASPCSSSETVQQLVTAGELAAQDARITALETQNTALAERMNALETLLAGVSRTADTLLMSGLNLQVVNGTGATEDLNGLGNLIVGYNAPGVGTRTGSHNLVIGDQHSYTSTSGIVSGTENTLSGPGAFVSGRRNTASGQNSFVGGGDSNTASGVFSFTGGGSSNQSSGSGAFIGGGLSNTASGQFSFVGSGQNNITSASSSFVGGGGFNTASVTTSFVGGGQRNTANATSSFVGGGSDKTAGPGLCAWLANANLVPC